MVLPRVTRRDDMSQTQHSEHESVEAYRQHSENAHLESTFGISWRNLEADAKIEAAGTAVHEGAQKIEAFFETVLEATKVLAVVAVAVLIAWVGKAYIKAK